MLASTMLLIDGFCMLLTSTVGNLVGDIVGIIGCVELKG